MQFFSPMINAALAFRLKLAVPSLILPLLLASCSLFDSKSAKDKDEYSTWTAEQFYAEGKKALSNKNYEKAVKLYEKLEARYPFGQYSLQAQLDVIYAHYKNDEPDSALAAADRFIKANPTNERVDYAYYLKGLVNYNRGIGFIDRFLPTDTSQRDSGPARESIRDFNELLGKFPRSKYSGDAQQRMISLRNNLAMYEVHVADFYMRRGGYLAAARRCAEVAQNYPRSQAVPKALKIMEEAYRKLGMDDLADDAARVYAHNYGAGGKIQLESGGYELTLAEKIWDFLGFDR
jgi:outer membrane protein assembly factor BamD